MSSDTHHPDARRIDIPGAEFSFNMFPVDGMLMPLFTGMRARGPLRRLEEIRDMDMRKDDIILTTHPKSGIHSLFTAMRVVDIGH